MSEENIGEQFKGIAGYDLLGDITRHVEAVRKIVKPHADKAWKDRRENGTMDPNPAIWSHEELGHIVNWMTEACDSHSKGDWKAAKKNLLVAVHGIGNVKQVIQEHPWSDEEFNTIADHIDDIGEKALKYNDLRRDV